MRSKWCMIAGIVLLATAGVGVAQVPEGSALINVRVPEFADVWVAGEKTHLQGTSRDFVTPELDANRRHFYDIRARWIDDRGVALDITRRVPVRSGDRIRVDFDAAMARAERAPAVIERAPVRERTAFYLDITEDAKIPQSAALIRVHVPANAEIWLSGEKQHQGGGMRKFMTKPLEEDKNYTAEIRAKWKEDGLEVDQSRKVELHPGDRITVDFTKKSNKRPAEDNP